MVKNANCNYNHFRGCFHCFTQAYLNFFPWKSIISSKVFMKLPMDNKGKVVDNYLFNLKLIVKSRIKTVMSCCIDLHYLLYYRYDLHCGMSGDWSGEVSLFVPLLSFSQLSQPDNKKQFIKKLISNLEYRIFKMKNKFLTTTVIIFFNSNKRAVLTLTFWWLVVAKGQTYLKKITAKNSCLL